jgi:hypothetical protein
MWLAAGPYAGCLNRSTRSLQLVLMSSSPGQPAQIFGELMLEVRQQLFNTPWLYLALSIQGVRVQTGLITEIA